MVNVMVIVMDMQRGYVVKMNEEERIKQEEEIRERIVIYEDTKADIANKLENENNKREKEYLEYRLECCNDLIDQCYDKINPTKKKEMYK